MANYIATTEELTAVADAIRAKGGTSEQLVFPDGFVSAIGGIESSLPSAVEVTFGCVKKTETVTEQAPEGKCWYNGVLLPEIPADVLASYLYATIVLRTNGTYRLLLSGSGFYYKDGAVYNKTGTNNPSYLCSEDLTVWDVENVGSSGWSYAELIWSNHNIPNGSATATEIYFNGSEPLTELTETITNHVPVERESNYSITSTNLNDIAKRTQEMARTSKLLTPEDIIYLLNSVKFFSQSHATSEFALTFESTASG